MTVRAAPSPSSGKARFVLLGVPDDRGVAVVGGRVGAKEGPAAIRRALLKMGVTLGDEGDLSVEGTQEETYRELCARVAALYRGGFLPILLGGGHDLSFGSLSGFLEAHPGGGVVNVDPHLDARPIQEEGKIPSGSPFRLLLERGVLAGERLMEFGFRMECNTKANRDYLLEKKVRMIPWPADFERDLRPFAETVPALAVSFDMDSVQAEFAPGVSAPAAAGYTPDQALALMEFLRELPNLRQMEIMETNPRLDPEGKTARLAARLIATLVDNPLKL